MFLNPKYDWEKSQQKRKLLSEKKFTILVNDFVKLIRKDPNAGKNKIKRYVMNLKQQIDNKQLNPNTARNIPYLHSLFPLASFCQLETTKNQSHLH